jgi:serine protease inhibitor
MWTCPKCGAKIENELNSCGKCEARALRDAQSHERSRRWRVAVVLGLMIEVGIAVLVMLLPHKSWLCAKIYGFLHFSHFPIFWLLNLAGLELGSGGIIMLPLVGLAMGLVWACLLLGGWTLVCSILAWLGLTGRQKRLLWWSACVLCAAGLVYAMAGKSGDKPLPFTPTPVVNTLVVGNTAFALDLYQRLRATPGNLFISPFGISTGLGLVYAGARGNTESELGRAAHFDLPQADLHRAFGELSRRMDRLQHGHRLTLVNVNGLWRQEGYPFLNEFLDLAHERYRAQAEAVDFKRAAATTSRINQWIARQTRGKIPTMLEPGRLDPLTRLVLCNVLYFKGDWRSQFDAKDTRPAPFFLSTNEPVSVPMMMQSADFRTATIEEPAAALLELPYYGGDLAMVIILPKELDELAEIENALTAENLNSWLARLDAQRPQEILVNLPRFTTRQSLNLIPVLRSLGIISAFDGTADFSGMDGTKILFLATALHRTFVEVNETGTEASAATLFAVAEKSMRRSFTADHPFLFLIRDHGSGTILFLGRLADPRS